VPNDGAYRHVVGASGGRDSIRDRISKEAWWGTEGDWGGEASLVLPGRSSLPHPVSTICTVVQDFVKGEEVDVVIVVDRARQAKAFTELRGALAQYGPGE
jgi:hypothetical protein